MSEGGPRGSLASRPGLKGSRGVLGVRAGAGGGPGGGPVREYLLACPGHAPVLQAVGAEGVLVLRAERGR